MTESHREGSAVRSVPGRLSAGDLELLNRQILMAAKAGAPLVGALRALSRDLRRGRLKRSVDALVEDLKSGRSLAEAFDRQSGKFPPLYVAMAQAAEASGNLHGIMEMLSHLVTSAAGLRRRILMAAAYPLIVLCAAAGFMAFLVGVLLPKLVDLFQAFPQAGATVAFLRFVMATGGVTAAAVFVAAVAFTIVNLAPGSGAALAARVPFIGAIVRSQRAFIFCRTFSVLLRAHVPMRQAVRVVREVSSGRAMKEALDGVLHELHAGRSLSQAMEAASAWKAFSPALVWTVSVAESRGDLPEGLHEAGEFYREDAERRSNFLMQVMPSVLIVFVGAFVAVVVFPVFACLLSMIGMIGQMAGGF